LETEEDQLGQKTMIIENLVTEEAELTVEEEVQEEDQEEDAMREEDMAEVSQEVLDLVTVMKHL
jgi:hypothetical protein